MVASGGSAARGKTSVKPALAAAASQERTVTAACQLGERLRAVMLCYVMAAAMAALA